MTWHVTQSDTEKPMPTKRIIKSTKNQSILSKYFISMRCLKDMSVLVRPSSYVISFNTKFILMRQHLGADVKSLASLIFVRIRHHDSCFIRNGNRRWFFPQMTASRTINDGWLNIQIFYTLQLLFETFFDVANFSLNTRKNSFLD
jgi:hypothetical protein